MFWQIAKICVGLLSLHLASLMMNNQCINIMCSYEIFLMNLGALDSISAHLVSYAEIRERSPASISTISKRQVDRLCRFPVRMKQALLRELEWLRRFSAVRHWVHDAFVFNTGVTLVTTSSI